ncbi:MAG: winged helix-turn-helix domain-containing protein [Patescibacteria group bacterium]
MFKQVSALFQTPLRIKILTFFLRRPGTSATVSEVASTLGVPRAQAQKELAFLGRSGVLRVRRTKNVSHFAAQERHELFDILPHFLGAVSSPSDRAIARVFRPLRGVTLVVASGLLVQESKSPIDLLIVSRKPDIRALEKAVKKVEMLSALPIRYAVLGALEYDERRQSYDRLLRDIFEYKHQVVFERGNG